jgi:hypothetical protein
MANNRIYLVCKKDHKYFSIAKYFPGPGWYSYIGNEDFNNWLEKHSHNSKNDMYGEMFDLVYEAEDRVTEIDFEKQTIKVGK